MERPEIRKRAPRYIARETDTHTSHAISATFTHGAVALFINPE
jgi:hypothetical protein